MSSAEDYWIQQYTAQGYPYPQAKVLGDAAAATEQRAKDQAAAAAAATATAAPPNQSADNSSAAAAGIAAPTTSTPGGTTSAYASQYSLAPSFFTGPQSPTVFSAPASDNSGLIWVLVGAVLFYFGVFKHA